MRIIHCADLHLDSAMLANLDGERARERRAELLETFNRMIRYAADNSVDAVIIAGDLFDGRRISATAKNAVYKAIETNPQIDFYYLKGNHDADGFLDGFASMPENLKLFGSKWCSYSADSGDTVRICGLEPDGGEAYERLSLDQDKINIVVLHGQDAEYKGGDAEMIDLRALKDKGIDYLALGHIHAYKRGRLDARGIYCYPGCLEGRGFDECGEHGFVLLETGEKSHTVTDSFVPFAGRRLYELEADISGCMSTFDITASVRELLAAVGCGRDSLIKLVLSGTVDYDCEKNTEYLKKQLEADYYFVKIYDRTEYKVDYELFALDESLKGEFVRTVMAAEDLSDDERAQIIRFGIKTLAGEVPKI